MVQRCVWCTAYQRQGRVLLLSLQLLAGAAPQCWVLMCRGKRAFEGGLCALHTGRGVLRTLVCQSLQVVTSNVASAQHEAGQNRPA
jgi:hypothetical protein